MLVLSGATGVSNGMEQESNASFHILMFHSRILFYNIHCGIQLYEAPTVNSSIGSLLRLHTRGLLLQISCYELLNVDNGEDGTKEHDVPSIHSSCIRLSQICSF